MAKRNSKKKEPLPPSVREYRKWRNLHYGLRVASYASPFVPFGVALGVNWNEWFPPDANATPTAIGLVMAVATLALSVVAMCNKDSEQMKKIGVFIPIGFAFLAWGVVCVLLSNILMELGKALLFTGVGILASAVEDSVDRTVVKEKYLYMKDLVDSNGLTESGAWKQEQKQQAEHDGQKQKVRFIPHD